MSPEIPPMAVPFLREEAKRTLHTVAKFVEEECIPADPVYEAQLNSDKSRWKSHPSVMDSLKERAKLLEIWNIFLPDTHGNHGGRFSNLEYGLMAEQLGKSIVASEACNCNPPDTGNMEVLARYGTEAQKERWLTPLLNGDIRSVFLMTEPDIASSDAKNIQLTMNRVGGEWVLNGSKWWSSGAGHANATIFLVMGKSSPGHENPYQQQSVILVPTDTPGIRLIRMMSVFGYDDAPHGHGHFVFNNVRVPASNILGGEGRGFEIVQSRLGPGRIHHTMRAIGVAERALEWMLARIGDERKTAFGKKLNEHGVILQWAAESRISIEAARLVVLNAAIKLDNGDVKSAMSEIAQAKVLAPRAVLQTLERAIQSYGGAGVSQDTPLAAMWAQARVLKIVDGPDEVHLQQLGKTESKRGDVLQAKIQHQKRITKDLLQRLQIDEGSSLVRSFL